MIGGTLEYLVSSLPNLSFQNLDEKKYQVLGLLQKYGDNTTGKLSPIEILDNEARKYLPASKFAVFQKINLKNIHRAEFRNYKSKVLTTFSSFTFELKKSINEWRISQDEEKKKPEKSKIGSIVGEGTPLEKEIRIMEYQWDKLEELSVGHFSDFDALLIYKIKLMILLRWWSFNVEKGMDHFIRITSITEYGR